MAPAGSAPMGSNVSSLGSLVRATRLQWRRWRRRRERSCVRCGAPAVGMCPACRSRVCVGCSVVSIETGAPVGLCLTCAGDASAGPPASRSSPWLLFRRGAGFLFLLIAVTVVYALEREGWRGAWRVILTVLHPAVLLGLVPLALVLGALVTLFHRLFVEWGRPGS